MSGVLCKVNQEILPAFSCSCAQVSVASFVSEDIKLFCDFKYRVFPWVGAMNPGF